MGDGTFHEGLNVITSDQPFCRLRSVHATNDRELEKLTTMLSWCGADLTSPAPKYCQLCPP